MTEQKQCIFCCQYYDDLTLEHVIPYSIGGSLTCKNVCKNCNSYLGSNVDKCLTDNFLVGMIRHRMGLLGRSGNFPHPLASGGRLVDEPDVGVQWRIGGDGRIIRNTSVRENLHEDGSIGVKIQIDGSNKSEISKILKKISERKAKSGYKMVMPLGELEYKTVKSPAITFSHEISISGLHQAMLKIAYEIAILKLDEKFISSTIAKKMRSFIMNPDANIEDLERLKIRGQISFLSGVVDIFEWIKCDHLIVAIGDPVGAIYIRIFDFYYALVYLNEDITDFNFNIENAEFVEFDARSKTYSTLSFGQMAKKYLPEASL